MFDCDVTKQHGFHDSLIETLYYSEDGTIYLRGLFDEWECTDNTGCKYYYFRFSGVTALELPKDEKDYADSGIIHFTINRLETGYDVSLAIDGIGDENKFERITFTCKDIHYDFYKYKGMSYKNMYNDARYQAILARNQEAFQEKYFQKLELQQDLKGGYTVKIDRYSKIDQNGTLDTFIEKLYLMRGDMIQFQCDSFNGHVSKETFVIIKHQNGRQYFLFKVHLYGISVYDIENGEVFHYIPEGHQHPYENIFGESFIITDIHYDPVTNLIAYGGCYWACPSDVMVGDFSNPMNFKREWKSMREIVDPEYELYDDVDFIKWEDGKLYLRLDMEKEEVIDVKDIGV